MIRGKNGRRYEVEFDDARRYASKFMPVRRPSRFLWRQILKTHPEERRRFAIINIPATCSARPRVGRRDAQRRIVKRRRRALCAASLFRPPPSLPTAERFSPIRLLVHHNKTEIGAAWSKRSEEGRDYLSLKLDDPSFTAPIYANLFDDEGGEGYTLLWSRSAEERRGRAQSQAAQSGSPDGAFAVSFSPDRPTCACRSLPAQRELHHRAQTRSVWLTPSALASSNNVHHRRIASASFQGR